ncbi:acyl transferase/acyl hydrolase/lysophospholipase [Diaporthe sp. PMI_573]|nr:acyl transferase/acyl hydrolase/lysophospholipase [Diaporthaceae sp. PMI_573]
MVNNFSAAGGNTSIVLKDAPLIGKGNPLEVAKDLRTSYVVTVSAKTPASLRGNVECLRDFMIVSTLLVSLADIAYTSTAKRLHHPLRKAYAVKSAEELVIKVEKDCAESDESSSAATSFYKPPSVVFAFPGQGSGIIGTAKSLPSILLPLFGKPSTSDPSLLESQLYMALLEVAMVRLWNSWGVEPNLVIGYSLGEYAALYAAGTISAADMVFLIAKRASLI